MLLELVTQGSAPAARNPGLEVVNAFGVLVRVAQPALDHSSMSLPLKGRAKIRRRNAAKAAS